MNTMEPPIDILIFGDQTGDYNAVFRNIFQAKDDVLLSAFLGKAYKALRHEVPRQPSTIQDNIPSFSSINDLVGRYAEPGRAKSNALESALTCASQLACFFSGNEVTEIFQSIATNTLDNHAVRIPISSTSASNWYSTQTLRETLYDLIRDILVNPLRWDLVLDNVASEVKERDDYHCNIIRLGPSTAAQSLISALKGKSREVTSDDRFAYGPTRQEGDDNNKSRPKIAICGLSGRFPDAADHEAFWKLLEKGLDLHKEIPKDRFDTKTHVDPDGKRPNTSHTPFGCFIDEPGLFDPRFFNMSPREAAQTDPMHRLALVTAYEALEMSGYVENRTASSKLDRVGTFYGQTSDDWREIQAAQKVDTYFIPGGVRAFAPGRINYFFNFSGPSFSVDTACSSSLAAIQLACTSLITGQCDTALAGGMNVLTNPDIFSGLSRGQFLSKKGPCATFDDGADGYCRGDGVGSVVLKRLEDAQADKDPILAVILGADTNHSAEAVSITHPHAGAQKFLYSKILNNAGVDPHDVSYVEMHGTGTQAGDAIEMDSVSNTFAPRHRQRGKDQSVHLGAVKANAGHGEAASGITALIKVLTMLDKNMIPPHCGIKDKINRTFPKDLEARNVHIALKPTPWNRPNGKKRRLFLNNFSAAGGNTALLLEDGDIKSAPSVEDKRSTHVVAVTARTKVSLTRNVESLLSYLEENAQVTLPSLSYTTTARRTQHTFRITVAASDLGTIKQKLKSSLDKDIQQVPKVAPKVTLMFTGQGSHYVSMAKQLFETSPQFQSDIAKFEKSVKLQGFPSILPLIDGSVTDISALPSLVVQLGATCVQMALYRLFHSWGIEPAVVVGHSLGEYAALNAASVLSASDTIYLCGTRAKLLQEHCQPGTHSMLAIKASVAALSDYVNREGCEIACINASEETVMSGPNEAMDNLVKDLKDNGFKATKLSIPFAFHSAQVEAILDEFEAKSKGVAFNKPSIPVISPLLNKVVTSEDELPFSASYMRDHCRKTVNFLGGIEAAKHEGLIEDSSLWLEIGAHPICTGMVKGTLGPQIKAASSLRKNEDDWQTIANSMCTLNDAGLKLNWNHYHEDFDDAHELLKLPTYQFDNKNYWIEYTNDWTLSKGNAEIEANIPKPKFEAASVDRIVELDLKAESPTIVGEVDLTKSILKECIEGHEVNGLGLCPPVSDPFSPFPSTTFQSESNTPLQSLYCDMALVVAQHFYTQLHPDTTPPSLNVKSMIVQKPLIVSDSGPQLFHIVGTYQKPTNTVDFSFHSFNSSTGKRTMLHANCAVAYENSADWSAGWERNKYMVQTRIDHLLKALDSGEDVDLIKRGMAYKLFGGLIHYGHKYRGMESVVLDNENLEATASVKFQTGGTDDGFLCSPYRTDSAAHLSGFIMLGNRNAQPSKEVYVSHGWDNYRVLRPLTVDKTYRSYVKMHQESAKAVVGDLYVFDGEEIVAVVEGLRFHNMPRQLMDSLLAAASGKPAAAKPKPKPAPPAKKPHASASEKPKSPAPAPAAATKPTSTGLTAKAMDIIADELGVPATDLSDGSAWADLGVDSLLSLNISGKFKEELGLDVASTLFVDFATVGGLKGFLAEHDGGGEGAGAGGSGGRSVGSSSGESSPERSESGKGEGEGESVASDEVPPTTPPPPAEEGGVKNGGEVRGGKEKALLNSIHATVSAELGVKEGELDATADLSAMGMDSLMSLNVLGKLKEDTGADLPSDFFANHATLKDIEGAL
ncbi:Type I Iterative PKS [Bacidia gigantensis]|uniref:Type I Iterative PKS n=1 Tax=Bacidia gigantensis TaxID=2732470 RepID=UPI001D0440AE|nr:Type I Iterative PKS [Bacidia gigantensis]KAG8527337.1 Type I Iterative PKS [Bacidia gigantensis]